MADYIVAKKMSTIALSGGRAFLCLLASPLESRARDAELDEVSTKETRRGVNMKTDREILDQLMEMKAEKERRDKLVVALRRGFAF